MIDAAAPNARERYTSERAAGSVLAVHGSAPWVAEGDAVDVGTAAHLALYADEVIGAGLPASFSPKVQ